MTTFKKGDVVQLKSGGPPMTISGTEIDNDETVYICDWIDTNGEPRMCAYSGEQLILFDLTTEED